MHPVVDATKRTMRTQTLMFLALAAVAGTACNRTALDNSAPGSSPCGDKVLDGYLVDGWACPHQLFSVLPAFRSKEGLSCSLDVYLSEQVPANAIPAFCSEEPFTSKCFLEATGFIGSVGSDIAGYPRVSLVGSMQTADVCAPIAKCAPMTPECLECQQQEIFVPCQVSAQ
jgi:hypothetical protein